MSADNWQCPRCANVVSTLSAACHNCGYDRRTMPDPTRLEPKLPPGGALSASSFSQPRQQAATQREIGEEMNRQLRTPTGPSAARAELQVSLLNALSDEMRATNKVNVLILDRVRVLTAQGSLNCERLDRIESLYVPQIQEHVGIISAALENIGETQAVQRAALEGIQGLLVDNEAGIGTLGEGIAAILARLDHDSIAGLWERLGRIDAAIDRAHAYNTSFYEELPGQGGLATRLAQIELRISHIGAQLTVFAQERPRKAGKRKRVKR